MLTIIALICLGVNSAWADIEISEANFPVAPFLSPRRASTSTTAARS